MPRAKFVGKRYREEDKKNGTFGWLWDDWFQTNRFVPIEALPKGTDDIEDQDAYCGMSRIFGDGRYEYWIGMIVSEASEVPEGYESFPVPACEAVVNWVYGKEPDVYFHCCLKDMEALGYQWKADPAGERLMAERYVCPRFTSPDENGNLILDLVYFTNY